mmetsp:Transcript_38181/g.89569  ORF Transcript_38181/g.89569 Transcript_38181/m.89569 type:complete len:368 (-) Transcript_38181:204-1307(-)
MASMAPPAAARQPLNGYGHAFAARRSNPGQGSSIQSSASAGDPWSTAAGDNCGPDTVLQDAMKLSAVPTVYVDLAEASSPLLEPAPVEPCAADFLEAGPDLSGGVQRDAYYGTLLLQEREERQQAEEHFKQQIAEHELEIRRLEAANRAQAKEFAEERGRLLEQLGQKEELLEVEKQVMAQQMDKEYVAAKGQIDGLKDRLRQSRMIQQRLLKEVSALLMEREALKKELSRAASTVASLHSSRSSLHRPARSRQSPECWLQVMDMGDEEILQSRGMRAASGGSQSAREVRQRLQASGSDPLLRPSSLDATSRSLVNLASGLVTPATGGLAEDDDEQESVEVDAVRAAYVRHMQAYAKRVRQIERSSS